MGEASTAGSGSEEGLLPATVARTSVASVGDAIATAGEVIDEYIDMMF